MRCRLLVRSMRCAGWRQNCFLLKPIMIQGIMERMRGRRVVDTHSPIEQKTRRSAGDPLAALAGFVVLDESPAPLARPAKRREDPCSGSSVAVEKFSPSKRPGFLGIYDIGITRESYRKNTEKNLQRWSCLAMLTHDC